MGVPTSPLRIGIAGSTGFIGGHLLGAMRLEEGLVPVPGLRSDLADVSAADAFLKRCDQVVHLAGSSRDPDGERLYRENCRLAECLRDGILATGRQIPVYLGSTTHIMKELPYHASKRRSRELLLESGSPVITLRMPNAFGPYSRPFFNSVVSSFCAVAARGETPGRIDDAELRLIDWRALCQAILQEIRKPAATRIAEIPHRFTIRLPELWEMLRGFQRARQAGEVPSLDSEFSLLLWETFCSYSAGR